MPRLRLLVAIGLLVSLAFSEKNAVGQTVVISSSRDSSIYSESNNSNGAGAEIFIGRNNRGDIRRGLVYFDIAAFVPAGATITDVQFDYNIEKNRVPAGHSIAIHRSLADWGEFSSSGTGRGAPAQAGDATWQQSAFGSTNWSSAGGDFAAASDNISAAGLGDSSATVNGLISDIQLFLDDPSQNFGFFLIGNEVDNQNTTSLSSREAAVTASRPSLSIGFTTAVPEPGAMLVVWAMATTFIMRRRRSV